MIFGIPFLLAIIPPALLLSGINYWYWRKQGYSSAGTYIIGVFAFYGLLFYLLKAFV